jgi:hypothetical protein
VLLEQGLEIGPLTDEELRRGVQIGAVRSAFHGLPSSILFITSTFGLRSTVDDEIRFSDSREPDFDEFAKQSRSAFDRLERGIDTLRLFKPGHIGLPAVFSFSEAEPGSAFVGMFGGVSSSGFGSGHQGGGGAGYELSAMEAEDLVGLHELLVRARAKSKMLDNAVHRFGFGVDRARADDRLTDFMIALEALMLGDDERGEKRFQVSLRASQVVGSIDGGSPFDVFGFIKRAYDVRSAIVHGGEPAKKHLRGVAGDQLDLAAFADEVERVTRAILVGSVEVVMEGREPFQKWQESVFGTTG